MKSEGRIAEAKEAKLGYTPNYTLGIYLSGISILLLTVHVSFFVLDHRKFFPVMFFDGPYLGFILWLLCLIIPVLFLLVKRKVIYLLFVVLLLLTMVGNTTFYAVPSFIVWADGLYMGIWSPLIIMMYLMSRYKSAFIPVKEEKA